MKLAEILAHLAMRMGEPLGDFTELLRAVREGAEKIDVVTSNLLRAAGETGDNLRVQDDCRKTPAIG